ncbi:hypothetical protein OIV83_005562 [Microbotryomycetes sp. JL201]|nr:hypothetical protein OIV83_005562 [Microbotryomycetes sp. JL201]
MLNSSTYSSPSSSPGSLTSASSTSTNASAAAAAAREPLVTATTTRLGKDPTLLTLDAAKLKLMQHKDSCSPDELDSDKPSNTGGNPQPFFPVATTPRANESPTTYQFPVILDHHQQNHTRRGQSLHTANVQTTPKQPTARSPSPPKPLSTTRAHHKSMTAPPSASSLPPSLRTRRQSTTHAGYTSSPVAGAASGNAASTSTPMDAANQLEAKVVILGSQGVGKTSIVHRYTSGHFSYSLSSTIGASFLTKKLVVDGCKVRLQIWDTAGQERFRSMAPLYYRGALAAILVYDITNEDSFDDIKVWLDELRRNMSPDLIIHVVGSKADLAANLRQVDLQEAKRSIASWVVEDSDKSLESSVHKNVRDLSPPSPSRPRIYSRRGSLVPNSNGGTASHSAASSSHRVPTITTSGPTANDSSNTAVDVESVGARVRTLSSKLGQRPTLTPSHSTTLPTSATLPTGSLTHSNASAASSVNDLNVLTTSAGSPGVTPMTPPAGFTMTEFSSQLGSPGSSTVLSPPGTTKSASSKFSLSFYGGAVATNNNDRGRKSAEEERKAAEEAELARLDDLVEKCGVSVTEVSAKDDFGIEDVFLTITTRLVERKLKIERDRVLRSRDSIMLRDSLDDAGRNNSTAGSFCCA